MHDKGLIVDGEADVTGRQRLWHFITAMLIGLEQTHYQFKRQQLGVSPPNDKPMVLPMPEFNCMETGFLITNWSLEQLAAFFRATEFAEYWYRKPDDKREPWAKQLDENYTNRHFSSRIISAYFCGAGIFRKV